MKSTTITPNLIQLTKFKMMNAYLVREDDGFTLIDTTLNAGDDIISAASDAGAEIKRIVLTHGHSDHIGSLDQLTAKLGSDVTVQITEIDAQILAGEDVDFGPNGEKRGGWPTVKTTLDHFIAHADQIGSLRVVASPGHTPGHVAFLDTRDNSLIAGDAFSSLGGLTVPNHANFKFPLPWFASCDRTRTLGSAQALRALNPTVLALGHGRVITDPTSAMDAALAAAVAKQPS